jgi:hypothetical protein
MPYAATVFNVMIASPGDVAAERDLARDIINEWNSIHSESRQMVLMPIRWDTNSHPSMEDRPQGILNKQILERADLLVAMFWTRIGTPTGEAVSGSVEEIERHVKAGKPAMIYFSSAPAKLEKVDHEQYKALTQFKAELRKRGLCGDYESTDQFAEMFRRQLATKLNGDASFRTAPSSPPQTPAAISAVVEKAQKTIPTLSADAKTLLTEAAMDSDFLVIYAQMRDQTILNTNRKEFIQAKYPRSRSKWERALKELAVAKLIYATDKEGEMWVLTQEGHDLVQQLRP